MAIKGKKKSQSRGSQGQRRPAAAPRPVYTGRKHVPWYKKTEGRLIGGLIIAVVIGVSIWAIADAQNKSKERTAQREALEEYVQSVRSFTTKIAPVAEEMGAIPPADPDVDALKEDAAKWTSDLTAAQAQMAALAVPPDAPDGANVANDLFVQAMSSFVSAARTFESVPKADEKLQPELLAQATEEREQAATLFSLAVDALDLELEEVGGGSSNLSLPTSTQPVQPPDAAPSGEQTIEIPPAQPGGGGGGAGGGGAGGGGAGGGGAGGGGQGGGGDQGDGN